ncbi:MAG: hypothetical protein FD125_1936 [bacterium]|nr:MAG: hypothetical protein FD125_1936 [bacterium]
MRTAVLIAATAAALTLSACNRPEVAATDTSTEAAEASGAAVDTAATTGGASGGTNAAGGAASGEAMDPAAGGTVSDGAMTSAAQPGDTAGNNVTETERRLNPPTPQ